jgi:hypothetical protein
MSVSNPVIDYIDPVAKRIFLRSGVREYHPVTDIYTEIRYLRRTDESLRPFDMPVSAFGNEPKGGGRFTPRYARFNNGWKIVPANETHSLYIGGEQITDEGESGPAAVDTTMLDPGVNVIIHYEPPAAEIIREAVNQVIIRQSYEGRVVYDAVKGEAGNELGIGTRYRPVNNFEDAKIIAQTYGLSTIYLNPGVVTITDQDDLSGYIIEGNNALTTMLIVEPGAQISNCEIKYVALTGTIDSTVIVRESYLFDLDYVNGFIFQCQLAGVFSVKGPTPASLMTCFGGANGVEIDLNNDGHMIVLANFSGDITFSNKTDATPVRAYISAGSVTFDPSVTNGDGFILEGVGRFINNSTVDPFVCGLVSNESIEKILEPKYKSLSDKIDETQAFVLAS